MNWNSIMNLRQTQRAKTRQILIDTTWRIFADQGISATRTADVASAAGLSHGAVFAHFSTREDLVVAAVEAYSIRFRTGLDERLVLDFTVRGFLEAHLAQVAVDEALYSRIASEGSLLPDAARSAWLNVLTNLSLRLDEAVSRLPPSAQVRKLPLALVFNTWIGLLHHHLSYRDLYAPDGNLVARRGVALLDFMTALLDTERMEP